MSHFKDKLQVFFLGLLLGLLLGGGFFLFKLDQYVKELSIYKSFTQHNEQSASQTGKEEQIEEKKAVKPVVQIPAGHSNELTPSRDTAHKADKPLLAEKSISDSLKSSDSLAPVSANQDDIVLKKDELLFSRSVELINISPVANNISNSKDSLAAKVAGVRDDRPSGRQFCPVEIWTSPLNYKGYKMSRTKIILYGLNDADALRLFKLDDEIYLHCGSQVFRMEYTNEFHPYEKVISENILSKLK
jgi:hypothetical protein